MADIKAMLGTYADAATEADIARFTQAVNGCKKETDKQDMVKEFKKLLRNRRGVAEAKPTQAMAVKAPVASAKGPTTAPQPAATGVDVVDDDEFELDSLFCLSLKS